jgi:hypothetical protein
MMSAYSFAIDVRAARVKKIVPVGSSARARFEPEAGAASSTSEARTTRPLRPAGGRVAAPASDVVWFVARAVPPHRRSGDHEYVWHELPHA